MARYLIKATYLDGDFEGHSYFMRKGGYVTSETMCQFEDTTYASYNICMRQCKRLAEQNELDVRLERKNRAWKKKKGWKVDECIIFNRESYEPYEVPSDKIYKGM